MNTRSQKGFSLVELMIVVGIIGILATIAVPKFQQFQAKAKMSEAKINLTQISTLEESYSLDNNTYSPMTLFGRQAGGGLTCGQDPHIGFLLEPCNQAGNSPTPRFGYTIVLNSASSYTANAATGAGAQNLVCPGLAANSYDMSETRFLSQHNQPNTAAVFTCAFTQ